MIIIEVRGGIVQEVYTDAFPQSVYVIDYDNAEVGADKLLRAEAKSYYDFQSSEPKLFKQIIKLENKSGGQ